VISIGMSLDLPWLALHLPLVLGAAVGLVVVKLTITGLLIRSFGLSWTTSMQTGLLLGPGGEFSFVILGLALGSALISPPAAKLGLAAAALTMSVIPLLSRLGVRLASRFQRVVVVDPRLLPPEGPHAPRVIIAGFGRVGRMVAAMLDVHRVAYIAIDSDADLVAEQRATSPHLHYGDMTSADLLHRLDLAGTRALVVTLDRHGAAAELVRLARHERPDLLIVARAREAEHAARLYGLGATDAVPEAIEASLQLSEAVLVDLGVPMGPVIASIHEKRAEIQAQIRQIAPEARIRPLGRRSLRDAGQPARP
jgi:CPA2 family monovalent cation:H+ antiporter-2